MKQLSVSFAYSSTDFRPMGSSQGSPLALPLLVMDADGGVIADGVASSVRLAQFDIPDALATVFVRLTWPSGRTQTQRADFGTAERANIQFSDGDIAQHEWSAWAIPRLNVRSSLARRDAPAGPGIAEYDRVWLRLWQRVDGEWQHSRVQPREAYGSKTAKQLELELDATPTLLQIGSSKVPWRLVSLPTGGSCRVLLTPGDSADPRADPLKVLTTGFRSDAETLLEFLVRDELRAATALYDFQPLATRLLAEKTDDPLSAVVGAYFLLRTNGWNRIPDYWFENLWQLFPQIPDTAIIRCVVKLRAGLANDDAVTEARALVVESLDRGMPVYAEGLALLKEAASLLRPERGEPRVGRSRDGFDAIDRLSAASAWAGSAFSFYGKSPADPDPVKFVGMPRAPRRFKRSTWWNLSGILPDIRDAVSAAEFHLALPRMRATRTHLSLPAAADETVPIDESPLKRSLPTRGDPDLFFLEDIGR
jgi:hypothetical protein